MTALPPFELGVSNGWILLVAYGIGLLLALVPFSKDDRLRLFADPKVHLRGLKRIALHIGQFVAVGFIVLMLFTPITHAPGLVLVGTSIYVLGYSTVLIALRYFRRATVGHPATHGPYRVSRNPQWVGLFLVLLGAAITSGAWLMVVMVLLVGCVYHIQILEEEKACSTLYGEPYLKYLRQVPRYFLLLLIGAA